MARNGHRPELRGRVVILTAFIGSYLALRKHLSGVEEVVHSTGTIYEVGTFGGASGGWSVALSQTPFGNADTVVQTARAISHFNPDVVMFVGLAEGVKGVTAGDVVAASKVYEYEPEGEEAAHREESLVHVDVGMSSHRLVQRAMAVARSGAWAARVGGKGATGGANAAVGPVAASERLTRRSDALAPFVPESLPDVVAIEAESLGFMRAAEQANAERLVVLGISHVLGEGAQDRSDAHQGRATQHAAAFAFEVLDGIARGEVQTSGKRVGEGGGAALGIGRVSIRNLRVLTDVTWESGPRGPAGWHVVLGNNGAGKSTFLRAIALALLDGDDAKRLPQPWSSWLPRGREQSRVVVVPAEDRALKPRNKVPLARGFELVRDTASVRGSTGGGTVRFEAREAFFSVEFSAAYGAFRRFTGGSPDIQSEFVDRPRIGRHASLFYESVAFDDLTGWMQKLLLQEELDQQPAGERFLPMLQRFINESGLLPDGTTMERVDGDGVHFRDGNDQEVRVEQLSDGYRSILSLALDLLRHIHAEFGPRGTFDEKKSSVVARGGVVMIDEVDAHLHPTWQRRIGQWFKRCFPRMQFFVATHSALVCQAADTVLLLPRPGTTERARMLDGDELARVRDGDVLDAYATGVFGENVSRSDESQRKLERLATLNQRALRGKLDAAEEKERRELQQVLISSSFALPHTEGAE
jgi:nucleoside phosphorylase